MKILFNGLSLNHIPTGVQYYIANLAKELLKQAPGSIEYAFLLPKEQNHHVLSSDLPNVSIRHIPFVTNKLKRVVAENIYLPAYYRKERIDVIHAPAYVLPYFMNLPSVLTVHDLIALDYPKFCRHESILYFNLFLSRSIRNAIRIIAVSNKVKEDILRRFEVSPDRIHVIYHGIGENFKKVQSTEKLNMVKAKYKLIQPFILFVGNIEPKKNLERLIEAFYLLRRYTKIRHKLVLVGQKGWRNKQVYEIITRLDIASEILFTGYVPGEDLPGIYSLADIFVFPSLYEGFGIPPLEAMACETPVLVSNQGALPEITGGNCLQVNPYDINEIARGIYTLLTDENLRKRQVDDGKMWAKQFTWERTAIETLRVYEKAMVNTDLSNS